jgi:hypothetical protein
MGQKDLPLATPIKAARVRLAIVTRRRVSSAADILNDSFGGFNGQHLKLAAGREDLSEYQWLLDSSKVEPASASRSHATSAWLSWTQGNPGDRSMPVRRRPG